MAGRSGDILKQAQEELEIQKQILQLNRSINNEFKGYLNAKKNLLDTEREIAQTSSLIEAMDQNDDVTKQLKKELDFKKRILEAQRQEIKNTSVLAMSYKALEKTSSAMFAGFLPMMAKYIIDADKAYKTLNLEIGLSGDRSKLLLSNLNGAAEYAHLLGVSYEDLTKAQGAYTSEMGTAVSLSSVNLKNIIAIAKGSGMAVDATGKMVAKFSEMGKSVGAVKDFYEDAINQSAQFGVSAGVVLQKINDNLDKSQSYVFKGGIEGLKKMALFSTKFKVDMDSVFGALDKANSLEGAVDMVSQLQVIGGKFAQQDPFKLLYQARNDASGFTQTMQGLTKGMANYNKTTGEFEIQAGDLNRLKLAADATGMSYKDLITQAKRGAQVDLIDSMLGGRLNKKSKEFVESIAQIQKDGSFKVQLANGEFKDIRALSEGQISALRQSNDTLEKRAQSAQAFDAVFLNIIESFKAATLPIIQPLNNIIKSLQNSGFLTKIVGFGTAIFGASALIGALTPLVGGIKAIAGSSLFSSGASAGGAIGTAIPNTGPSGAGGGGLASQIEGQGAAAGGAWKNMLAFGAAVLMVGGAIWLATKGIATMAESFKSLNESQLGAVNDNLKTLGIILAGAAVGIIAIGFAGAGALPAILGFGAAALLVGGGIALASVGIGFMAKSFGEMFDSISKVTDPKVISGLTSLVTSIAGLGASTLLFSNPLAWAGMKVFSNTIANISDSIRDANFNSLTVAATSFSQISDAIEKINEKKLDKLIKVSENLSGMGSIVNALSSINNMFGSALEVKFADDAVNLVVNLTNEIDGSAITKVISRSVPLAIERSKKGGHS